MFDIYQREKYHGIYVYSSVLAGTRENGVGLLLDCNGVFGRSLSVLDCFHLLSSLVLRMLDMCHKTYRLCGALSLLIKAGAYVKVGTRVTIDSATIRASTKALVSSLYGLSSASQYLFWRLQISKYT